MIKEITSSEHFTINSDKAAEILGVNRTRLSQLTSKGLFPYERRKVDSRSRLFYRLTDLLNYQRKSTFGNFPAVQAEYIQDTKALVPLLPPGNSVADIAVTERIKVSNYSPQIQHYPVHKQAAKRILQSALDVQRTHAKEKEVLELKSKIETLEQKLNNTIQLLNITAQILTQQNTKNLSLKKSMFKRPRAKRTFKHIK